MVKSKKVSKNSRLKKKYPIVRINFKAKFNNSIITVSDLENNVLMWSSSGKVGFKGSKKATPFASQKTTEDILEKLKTLETTNVQIILNGAGMGRDSFIRSIQNSGLQVDLIKDTTGFPFGGITLKKKRRV